MEPSVHHANLNGATEDEPEKSCKNCQCWEGHAVGFEPVGLFVDLPNSEGFFFIDGELLVNLVVYPPSSSDKVKDSRNVSKKSEKSGDAR